MLSKLNKDAWGIWGHQEGIWGHQGLFESSYIFTYFYRKNSRNSRLES